MTPKEIRQLAKDLASKWAVSNQKKTVELLNATADILESKTYFATLNAVTEVENIAS